MSDDVHDEGRDLTDAGPLGKYLAFCRDELVPAYEAADAEAGKNQRRHRGLTKWAGILGGIGLFVAAINVAFPGEAAEASPFALKTPYDVSLALEGGLALVATVLVGFGLFLGFHKSWLIARYKAERLRLLKFRTLVDPEFWCAGGLVPPNATHFRTQRDRILALRADDLASLAHREDDVPQRPSAAACGTLDRAVRLEIAAYYRRKRLDFQVAYFGRAAHVIERKISGRPGWLPLVFFTSVAFAVFHVASEHAGEKWHDARSLSLALAFGIPALWAALRTYRTANEFGRNESRSLAKGSALATIRDRIDADGPPDDLFADLGLCEYVLATDLGEWLRLMREAEWYG